MSGSFLLDTNIVSAWFQQDAAIETAVVRIRPALCHFVIGELLAGVQGTHDPLRARLARFYDHVFSRSDVAELTWEVTEVYASLRATLKSRGLPTPENDIWIAATALSHDLVLVTRDSHFARFPGLRVELW